MNDMTLWDFQVADRELKDAMQAIRQPRTNFQLKHFVVGQHDTEPRMWRQCVLELQLKFQNLKRAEIARRKFVRKIDRLSNSTDPDALDDLEIARLDLEDHDASVLGATQEAEYLYQIFKSFQRSYSREELETAEEEYWFKRLTRQARQEINATGTIGVGNQDALEQIGISPAAVFSEAQACIKQSKNLLTSLPQSPDTSRPDAAT